MEKKDERKILANRAIFRANSGFHFLDRCLTLIHRGGTDAAFSRSLHILFSYNFELILKSYVLLNSMQTDREVLLEEIKTHDLEKLSKKIPLDKLGGLGIKKVTKINTLDFSEYIIEQVSGEEIALQDFTDVRYDFGKDSLRKIEQNESKRMQKEVEVFLMMTKKIMDITAI